MVRPIEYLAWIAGRPAAAAHDLGSSDLHHGKPTPAGQVVPGPLQERADPEPGVTVGDQLARIYDVSRESVLVTAGATHAGLLAIAAAREDGPSVLVERPGYEPLRAMPRLLGARVDRFDRPGDADHLPDRLAAAADGETALAVVTNRHNPTGRLVDRDTLAAAARAVADRSGRLLVDEVYAPFVADGRGDRAFGGPTAAGLADAVVVGSLTKFHGLGGLGVGWLVADPAFVDRARTAWWYVPTLSGPGVALARRALAADDLVAAQRDRVAANHDLLATFVADRDDLAGPVPPGSPFAFLAHESADGDAVAEAAAARDLLVVPGRFFEEPARFRVSLGGEPAAMREALAVLGETLEAP